MRSCGLCSLVLLLMVTGCSREDDTSWSAFGALPDDIPLVFAPGVVSTDAFEFAITFTPGQDEMYFTRRARGGTNQILTMRLENGEWGDPRCADFSCESFDMEPHVTPNGSRLYFGSLRPIHEDDERPAFRQWYMTRAGEGWTGPTALETGFADDLTLMYVSSRLDGSLFFTVIRAGDESGIYVSEKETDGYGPAVRLDSSINPPGSSVAAHPFVAPDGSYLIFDIDHPDGYGSCDLFISRRRDDGTWSKSLNLGPAINTDQCEMCASVSPDGRYLFFHRGDDEEVGSIYWVESEAALSAAME